MEELLNRFCLAAFVCGLFTLGHAQTDPAAVVLTVNGDTIKAAEYFRRMEYLPGVSRNVGNVSLVYPPGFLALEALITERLIFQLAKQKGVMPTDMEIQAELNSMLTDKPTLLNDAALAGQTRADLEHQIKFQLAQFKIATFGINLTDVEVDKFYKDNPTIFTIPKRAKLSVIAVSDEATKGKVDADLAAGKPFGDVAKTYSEDITKSQGGEFGTVPIGSLPEPIRNAINATKIGQTSGWVGMGKEGTTQAKFFLHDMVSEERTPLDAKVRKQIRRQLMMQRGQVKNDVGKELAEIRSKAKIDIANKAFAQMYKKYQEEYLKQSGVTPPPN